MTEIEEKYGVRVCFNECSERAYRDMPEYLQSTIAAMQAWLQRSVLQVAPNAKASSGYRCSCENLRVAGKSHSRHLWGGSRDFTLDSDLPLHIPGCKVIKEKTCFHVEFE